MSEETVPYIKPDPEVLEKEQEDLVMSYLNPDLVSTDESHHAAVNTWNIPPVTDDHVKPQDTFDIDQHGLSTPPDYTSWLPMSFPPMTEPAQDPSTTMCLPQSMGAFPFYLPFVPPYPLEQPILDPSQRQLSPGSSSSSCSSLSDSEQPRKKRGRKKREQPTVNTAPMLAPAPAPTLLPAILPLPSSPTHHAIKSEEKEATDFPTPASTTPPSSSSSPKPQPSSTLSNDASAPVDAKAVAQAKRQERLIKNRAAALLSRKRKREYVSSLEEQRNSLTAENHELKSKVSALESQVLVLQQENQELRNQLKFSPADGSAATTHPISVTLPIHDFNPPSTINVQKKTATSMVFMIILFSFALFTLPSSRMMDRLTVGGAPSKQLTLVAPNKAPLNLLEGGKNNPPPTTDLIVMNSVQTHDLQSWINDRLQLVSKSEIAQYSTMDRLDYNKSPSSSSPASHVYLYSPSFSQVARVDGNNDDGTPGATLKSNLATSEPPVLSLISPFGPSSHPPKSHCGVPTELQEYLQVDVQVISSHVFSGQSMSLKDCSFASSLLYEMKDELIVSPNWNPNSSATSAANTTALKSDKRQEKGHRRRIVEEDRARKISRVIH
ncbi:uncharacterized protein BYT42DRAFT_571155 [Radiomyces spectabilis]|uniref:uncharacterized protein n=1 Tax=Radiomyces spectabilis TaxID=64574 RepID=UPI00221FEBAE|nr:uncharacterized protein BYT42DRAFT_571155 [Radiomyces spectabilis]KAI8377666.1 hypothetical protein BYT42DRAFT_571155 [Radiomyces spectabilis]